MPGKPVNGYRLSPAARRDLDEIWDRTVRTWSLAQAETYLRGLGDTLDTICRHPEIARERREIDPPVRLHPYRAHLIIYRIGEDSLHVIRIVHGRRHWQALLES
jgi:toxin ParE1/3/4